MDSLELLADSLASAGLPHFGLVPEAAFRAALSEIPAAMGSRLGMDSVRSVVALALPYGDGPSQPPDWAAGFPGPLARIGRFARANWYKELVSRLGVALRGFRSAMEAGGMDPGPAADWRRLANSGLPERRLAVEAGLGLPGRHGLVMIPGHGSAVVLGLLLAPIPLAGSSGGRGDAPLGGSSWLRPSPLCEGCGACVAACPTGALSGPSFARELCLQHWSSVPGDLPPRVDAAWGDRLYGCDSCQEACPLFKPDPAARSSIGPLGPGLPASWLRAASEGEIRDSLKGSALGMSWISVAALKRNAGHLT